MCSVVVASCSILSITQQLTTKIPRSELLISVLTFFSFSKVLHEENCSYPQWYVVLYLSLIDGSLITP